jgi:hypothetical protein
LFENYVSTHPFFAIKTEEQNVRSLILRKSYADCSYLLAIRCKCHDLKIVIYSLGLKFQANNYYMYIRNYSSKNQKAAYYMVNKALLVLLTMAIGTPCACLAVAGLPSS